MAIKKIDKNLSETDRTYFVRNELLKLIAIPNSDQEACLAFLKNEFKYNSRQIEAFKRDFNEFKKKIELEQKQAEYKDALQKFSEQPKELTEEEKQEALAFLQDPDLIFKISKDIGFAGEVVGEENNKMMLYFAAISRKFKEPISVVLFGKSSSGKSYLANAIEKFVPPEDKLVLSSSSTRAFEYIGESLKHKLILVQEWEGMQDILPTIRTLQSEGRLSRLVTIKNPVDNTPKTVANAYECPCSVIVTTTQENIHDENSTRIFELHANDTVYQTQNVVKQTILMSNIKNRNKEKEKEKVLKLHHNAQRMLETIEVDIPYAEHLSFPARTTRNRRDAKRFIQLIKTIAFLRQKQKEIKTYDGIQYIEADLIDYDTAYYYGIPVMESTLDQISDRAKYALLVCCDLMDDLKEQGLPPWFTVNQIQEKAPHLNLDFGNRQDLYKQLNTLVECEYLEVDQPKPRGKKYYTVTFNYVRNEFEEIINIGSKDIREITTYGELYEKVYNKKYVLPY